LIRFVCRAAVKIAKEFPNYELVMIDSKDYFENTIAVLTTLTHVDIQSSVAAAMKIVIRHDHYLSPNARFIKEMVKEITPTKVILDSETIYYDYLIIACGTSYRSAIKAPNLTSEFRVQALSKDAGELAAVDSVLVVGGGLVGVELASEIACKYPQKKIILATSGDRVLERMKPGVSAAAHKWLTSHGVEIRLGERVTQSKKNPSLFRFPKSKTDMTPGKAYWCTGFEPNNGLLQKHFESSLAENGYVKVSPFLQLEGHDHVFVIGDLANLQEEKMAERATAHAAFVVKSLKTLAKGETLTKVYKSPKKPPMMVISLGPEVSLLCTNRKLTTQGAVAASVKRWSFRAMMVKQLKTKVFTPRLQSLNTRLAVDKTLFCSANQKVGIIGHFNKITADMAALLSQFGVEVHILCAADVDKNIADQVASKNPELIKSHHVDPKIPNTIANPLRGMMTALIPYAMPAMDPLDLIEPYIEPLRNSVRDGTLKNVILAHPGYFLEKAPKKNVLAAKMRTLEEAVRSIDTKLNVVILRYAPTFEMLHASANSIRGETPTLRFPLPNAGIPFIAVEDIRDTIIKIMSCPKEHENQVYSMCGDTRVTPQMACEAIKLVTGKDIAFERVESSALIGEFTRMTNAKFAPMYVEWWASTKHLTKESEDLQSVLDMPSIGVEDWCQLNSHIFV
jgi:NADH dehydrogenase FAD-containing subunit